jgi:C4-type Zn-finger protein
MTNQEIITTIEGVMQIIHNDLKAWDEREHDYYAHGMSHAFAYSKLEGLLKSLKPEEQWPDFVEGEL